MKFSLQTNYLLLTFYTFLLFGFSEPLVIIASGGWYEHLIHSIGKVFWLNEERGEQDDDEHNKNQRHRNP